MSRFLAKVAGTAAPAPVPSGVSGTSNMVNPVPQSVIGVGASPRYTTSTGIIASLGQPSLPGGASSATTVGVSNRVLPGASVAAHSVTVGPGPVHGTFVWLARRAHINEPLSRLGFDLDDDLRVTSVDPTGPAKAAGVRQGQLLFSVNAQVQPNKAAAEDVVRRLVDVPLAFYNMDPMDELLLIIAKTEDDDDEDDAAGGAVAVGGGSSRSSSSEDRFNGMFQQYFERDRDRYGFLGFQSPLHLHWLNRKTKALSARDVLRRVSAMAKAEQRKKAAVVASALAHLDSSDDDAASDLTDDDFAPTAAKRDELDPDMLEAILGGGDDESATAAGGASATASKTENAPGPHLQVGADGAKESDPTAGAMTAGDAVAASGATTVETEPSEDDEDVDAEEGLPDGYPQAFPAGVFPKPRIGRRPAPPARLLKVVDMTSVISVLMRTRSRKQQQLQTRHGAKHAAVTPVAAAPPQTASGLAAIPTAPMSVDLQHKASETLMPCEATEAPVAVGSARDELPHVDDPQQVQPPSSGAFSAAPVSSSVEGGSRQPMTPHAVTLIPICNDYLRGRCRRATCSYRHIETEVAPPPQSTSSSVGVGRTRKSGRSRDKRRRSDSPRRSASRRREDSTRNRRDDRRDHRDSSRRARDRSRGHRK